MYLRKFVRYARGERFTSRLRGCPQFRVSVDRMIFICPALARMSPVCEAERFFSRMRGGVPLGTERDYAVYMHLVSAGGFS